jgi:hypothetical protein
MECEELRGSWREAEFALEEDELEGVHEGALGVIGGAAMTAFDIFVVEDIVFLLEHSGDHFSGVGWMHAVVAGGCDEQGSRIGAEGDDVMIGGVALEEGPLVGLVRVTIFGHPTGPGEELVIALHVEQGDSADDSAEEIGALGEHIADEQTAIGAAADSEVAWRGDISLDQIFGDCDEVVVGGLAIFFQGGLVPGGAELATAADIGEDIDTALFEPCGAGDCAVAGEHGDFETSIPVEQGAVASIQLQVIPADLEVRDEGSILREGMELIDAQAGGIEEVWQAFEAFGKATAHGSEVQAGGREEISDGQPIVIGVVGVHAPSGDGPEGRNFEGGTAPLAVGAIDEVELIAHVIEFIDDQEMACAADGGEGFAARGLEQDGEVVSAVEEGICLGGEEGAGGIGCAIGGPVGSQGDQELILERAEAGVLRDRDGDPGLIFSDVIFAGIERDGAAEDFVAMAAVMDDRGADAYIGGLTFEDGPGFLEGSATLPFLDDARVAGGRERIGAEIGCDVEGVLVPPTDVTLGFGQEEAIGDERFFGQAELARNGGVGAAAREEDQASLVVGVERIIAFEDPVFVFGSGEGVDIEHSLPGGVGFAVLLEGCSAEDAADVAIVLPEIVIGVAPFGDHGDAFAGIEDGEESFPEGFEPGVAGEFGDAGFVLLADPGEGGFTGYLFEPEEGIMEGKILGLVLDRGGWLRFGRGGEKTRGCGQCHYQC